MIPLKINEQIAFLRKQKGMTQEELAKALHVSNQAVSKWESGQCCPDIQLLPDLAKLFDVTIDELMGYQTADTFENSYLKIKSLFESTPEKDVFDHAFRLAILLHEVVCTRGYKGRIHWDTKSNYGLAKRSDHWEFSAHNDQDGSTVLVRDGIFFADRTLYKSLTFSKIRELYWALERVTDMNVLRVLYALYDLTVHDFDVYVSLRDISGKAKLSEQTVEEALERIPVTTRSDDEGTLLYRIEGGYMHIPPLLLMIRER